MRTMVFVCACLASLAGGVRLFAQDDADYESAPRLAAAGNDTAYETGSACENGSAAENGLACQNGSDEMVYDGAYNCGAATCDGGAACDGSQCEAAGPYPAYGPPRHPHAAGMAYYTKRCAQKTDAAIYGALTGVTHPCKTLHTIVENDIERKLKHCKCLGKIYGNRIAATRAANTPWHGDYYYPTWGAPVALVVPPTCEYQTNYSWGVPAHRIEPIDHQFGRTQAGAGYGSFGSVGFMPPPFQPNDTNQFGVYYVRGPW